MMMTNNPNLYKAGILAAAILAADTAAAGKVGIPPIFISPTTFECYGFKSRLTLQYVNFENELYPHQLDIKLNGTDYSFPGEKITLHHSKIGDLWQVKLHEAGDDELYDNYATVVVPSITGLELNKSTWFNSKLILTDQFIGARLAGGSDTDFGADVDNPSKFINITCQAKGN